jgi:hypothetical protein
MLTSRRVIAAKIETTEGTKETITGTESKILPFNPRFDPDINMNKRNPVRPYLSPVADVPGARLARLSFRVEMKGAGSAYSTSVKPAIGEFLRGCGFAETIVTTIGSEKATYDPASTGHKSLTLALYEDGVVKTLYGARGNVKFSAKNGEQLYADFDFLGVYDSVADAALPVPTYESTDPPVFLNSTITVAAYAAIIESINIDMANALQIRSDASKASGYLSTIITGREPNGSFDPEMVTVATHDFYGRWRAGTTGALVIGDVGATQYNRVKITAPKLQYRKVSDSDRGGIAIADTSFLLAASAGDDEIKITFS